MKELKESPGTCCVPPPEYRLKWVFGSTAFSEALKSEGNTSTSQGFAYQNLSTQIATLPLISIDRPTQPGESAAMSKVGPASFRIDATLSENARLTMRQGYFPSWQLKDEATGKIFPISPSVTDGLITTELPAGRHKLLLFIEQLPIQRFGDFLGALALTLCGLSLGGSALASFRQMSDSS